MHLLLAQPGRIADGSEAIDLGQTPGDIVVLSAADSELACLARATARLPGDGAPAVRLASLLQLGHTMSVDLYVEQVASRARLIVVRLLGGRAYWSYGVDELAAACRRSGADLVLLPGDERDDPELADLSIGDPAVRARLWRYLSEGGVDNAEQFLRHAAGTLGWAYDWEEPRPLLRAGLFWPGIAHPSLDDITAGWPAGAVATPIIFYRALVAAGDLAPIEALIRALTDRDLGPVPIFIASLKDPISQEVVAGLLDRVSPGVILNTTAFAAGRPGGDGADTVLAGADCPILQVVMGAGTVAEWRDNPQGLWPRDLAMNVSLPELDGRVLTRAISFKGEATRDPATQCAIIAHRPVPDRVAMVADQAAGWVRLRQAKPADRKVALVLANYPNRDGRIANGVGLDSPASALAILAAMAEAGYAVADLPADDLALMAALTEGPTNALVGRNRREGGIDWPLSAYADWLQLQPPGLRAAVDARWGSPDRDPFCEGDRFRFAALRLGAAVVAVQPARGYNIDPKGSYHDPALVPPHGYLAFYAWLRIGLGAHAVVHVGKHGNLEWLPGKALALTEECWPEAALGPLPHLYPFIVNDPGEGSQAKRRSAAVIVDHLTPPLTRAETYGPMETIERLVDEYFEASAVDPRRLPPLREKILEEARRCGLDADCGIADDDPDPVALSKLDQHLCDLKELQIRDGLHVLGRPPADGARADLLLALARLPRGRGQDGDAGLTRALAADLGLEGFDPLTPDLAAPWTGPRPAALGDPAGWRIAGDTVERLEILARSLVAGTVPCRPAWARTAAVLHTVASRIAPALNDSARNEIAAVLAGLDGRFVPAGPSGAPTRGRLDVLPTGRNFYSVDTRAVPTATAWQLGWRSAGALVDRHLQEQGDWPRAVAISAWGTSNMRTGGEDIAQALALLGVQPTWDPVSHQVNGFEILPASIMDRPRVDVTLRISGFFRDAFPGLIDLFDSAARAVAALDEPEAVNPLAARVITDAGDLITAGEDPARARHRAGRRVFGSKPGAYGAGLQAMIDERLWQTRDDLAEAYVTWGSYAYGDGAAGEAARDEFEARLGQVETVVHNQDNREHDLLDSDDYYQFEGGLTAAVERAAGRRPLVLHMDHARPETPVARTLEEEIARVVRGRATNPKWIAGVMRHGYRGASEIAATVDYLFAFAATTGAVRDHQFDAVYDAYLDDPAVRAFLETANPAAAREIAERLREALDRGLWQPRRNQVYDTVTAIAGTTDGKDQQR